MHQPMTKPEQLQALASQGKWAQARSTCQRFIQSNPADPSLQAWMAEILSMLDEPAQAIFYAQRAAALQPKDGRHLLRLAMLSLRVSNSDDALRHANAAVKLDDRNFAARRILSTVLTTRGQHMQAIEACKVDGQIPPNEPSLIACACGALLATGQSEQAVRLYRDAATRFPRDTMLASNLCNALNYMPGISDEEVIQTHRRYGELLAPMGTPTPGPASDPKPDRRLRVGVISPDLHRHSVAFFLLGLFEHLPRERMELVVFDTGATGHADAITRRLRSHAAAWREIGTISWADFIRTIQNDRIDVLIELSGHTPFHTLELMSRRPAPVQITYLGYPGTTGVSSIDYRIVDSITDPPPHADAFATEKLLRLDPCFLCFTPPDEAPAVEPPPSAKNGFITFGSFNSSMKLNDELLRLWKRVLDAVPHSRLLLKAMNFKDEELRQAVVARLASLGLDASRVAVEGPNKEPGTHLAQYSRLDIALDTYPYHGTTTTCEALHMGVPVVSLVGTRHVSRVGASLLHAVGLDELACADADAYVTTAASLAGDTRRLLDLRTTLRARMLASLLCDARGFAQRFEACVRTAWQGATSRRS